ncbi:UDP-N-acetylmuramoyl-L-alanyl-D-glutamate--2,6-diaminopimelate ligase [Acuticoccus sp. MNP-M23]|uniref:UDP-N-acetylmuramoyl-L-alanyl-D-glutamate--2, 6-diaminopimelate ligase n=1 Tax=Acuticoccus sp. MNP-M23 TaxID=3072793 RepID=UPI002814FEED|nr:UDP-N-acetylmuramoyl-L-alanyl-D-glutamate--2,6-diaminopimelate ligase [Acuticoccus sp. MNP-M23]WMS40849.1 UDP-N-acetylmuramoyl-L-alanyl-D-glutamate--2,6-diaminopimelate ligase [Acuticoccus sp. MNP-M23]
MRLGDLAPDQHPSATTEITGITADSRAVLPGMIFAALKGARVDGTAFVADALAQGASAVLCADDASVSAPVVLRDGDPRRRLALIAAALAGRQPRTIVAVTGTAGKTSVAEFTRQIFAASGYKAVSIGTLGVRGSVDVPGGLTTPDPVALHTRLAEIAAAGVERVAMEASSHGIDQRRLDGVVLAAAGFTNIGRDHLDYHADLEAYLAAKLRLFSELLPDGAPTVVDPDTPGGDRVLAVAKKPQTVGRDGDLIRLHRARAVPGGSVLDLECSAGRFEVTLPLIGGFQVENALVAAGLAIVSGMGEEAALGAISALAGAPGRLELIGRASGAPVFVDYAHKPEAITAALAAVRPSVKGRLIVVIGAGGDRDHGKRPLMGEAATRSADVVIVTDDNPRSEDPATIRAAILAAAPGATEIGDRGEAISTAVAMLRDGDALVVAGKGHEEGQTVAGVVQPFSDRSAVLAALAAL